MCHGGGLSAAMANENVSPWCLPGVGSNVCVSGGEGLTAGCCDENILLWKYI